MNMVSAAAQIMNQARLKYQQVLEIKEPKLTDMYAYNQAATRMGILYMDGKGVEKDGERIP